MWSRDVLSIRVRFGRAILVCLIALLAVGCETPVPPTPTPNPIKITFAFPAEQAETYDDLIAKFNREHDDITVERRTVRSGEIRSYLFREGQVDAFTFSTEGSLFTDRKEEDGILNLTPLIQQHDAPDLDDYHPSVLDPFTIEGECVGPARGRQLERHVL